jgi:multiple sugar transport system substrate-binding protein
MRTPKSRASSSIVAIAMSAVVLSITACGGGDDDGGGASASDGGVVTVTVWHGQNQVAKKTFDALVGDFNRTHPKIRVDAQVGALADNLYSKTTAALAGGKYPDVVYQFGPNVASLARSPKSVDLTDTVKQPAWKWDDFYPPAREAVTVGGEVHGVPAVIDSLAVVYNKTLFRKAGIPAPRAGWTWDDFRATAKRLTDKEHGVFGSGWPGVGDEDTTWRIWPMIWQLGGDVVTPDGKQAGFGGAPAQGAFRTIAELTEDKSLYVDKTAGSEQLYRVFTNGRMGMVPTGPWQLPIFAQSKVDYGVVPLPSYDGKPTTISGPDAWMVFDNGDARTRAAEEFVHWLTQPAQDARWDVDAGSLPLRRSTALQPRWKAHAKSVEGVSTFVTALNDARVRPLVVQYPKLSSAIGRQIAGTLLGSTSPEAAAAAATSGANDALAGN